jgi:hypothetical protein
VSGICCAGGIGASKKIVSTDEDGEGKYDGEEEENGGKVL